MPGPSHYFSKTYGAIIAATADLTGTEEYAEVFEISSVEDRE